VIMSEASAAKAAASSTNRGSARSSRKPS
jgi:hypothetical protein